MHQTRIRRAYYRIFRVANTPDLGTCYYILHGECDGQRWNEVHCHGYLYGCSSRTTPKPTSSALVKGGQRSIKSIPGHRAGVREQAAVCGAEDPGAGRTAAAAADRQVWCGQRKAIG